MIIYAINRRSQTPHAFENLPKNSDKPLLGANICIVGRSNIVGMPLNLALLKYHDAQVSLCHSRTPQDELIRCCQNADILVACLGIPNFIKPEWLKPGQIVIDVGLTYVDIPSDGAIDGDGDGKEKKVKEIQGDVMFCEETLEKVSLITPVPGGIGPMTITMLLNNLE